MAPTSAAAFSTTPPPPPASMPATSAVTAKASRENFPVASLLLPRHFRRALLGIYGFARLTDDIGDEAPGNREELLDWLDADVGRMYSDAPIHPLVSELCGWGKLAVAGYVGGGKAALEAIEASGYRVLGEPPRPTSAAKAAAAVRELKAAA